MAVGVRCCGTLSFRPAGGSTTPRPGLYLWVTHPAHDCWSAAELLADQAGILVAPGELYGSAGSRHVRVALTATDERIAAAARRLANCGRLNCAAEGLRSG